MTENRRIALNVFATYGRSLYALVVGLFCGRWALMALGEVDYGLMGVVGGLTAFIGFFNGILSGAISRYYAFSVGLAQKRGQEAKGLEECRRWFSVAVSIHTVVPLVLMAAGYPLGVWAVEHWLTIPADRVADCVWVFRFVCITCFLGMVSVPFNAMYVAKQMIAELTVYSFATSTLNVVVLYYMITHPGVWLTRYALWTCVLSMVPSLIIACRALVKFPECRLRRRHLWNVRDIRELASFAGWNLFGATGNLLKGAGMTVLVNKFFGPVQNAAVSIANTVAGHSQSLAGSMVGAFMPAITNACGAGDRERMVALLHRTCKFGALLVLPFALPLALEIDEVMVLWLKNPPAQSGVLCIWMMAVLVLENMTTGHWVAIAANGRIAAYQCVVGTLFILTLPLAGLMMVCGLGLCSVGYALFATLSLVAVVRIIAAKVLLGVSPRYWIFRILLPILLACGVSAAFGRIPALCFQPSFLRVCLTAALTECVLLPLAFFFVMDSSERSFLLRRLKGRPSFVARRLFAYDRNRFARHAGCFDSSSRDAGVARVIMAYHVLEKGLTMPRRHLDFGHAAVLNLIGLVEGFERRFGAGEPQVVHAIGCVKEYLNVHLSAGFDTSRDEAFWGRIKAFCAAHGAVPATKQLEFTRERFFADREAPFPVFAASRHTSRHYEGVVDVERIKSAVELAMTAPSACNRQFVKVYCVSNHRTRDRLFELQNGNRGFGSDADKLLVVTADLRGNRWAEERNDLYTNAGIFIMNLCYALHYNRIAHCVLNWSVSPENDRVGHELLGIPENEVIASVLCCGNAPASFAVATSPRKSIGEVFREVR